MSKFFSIHLANFDVVKKNIICDAEKNGIFLFEISFFILEMLTFFYYAN